MRRLVHLSDLHFGRLDERTLAPLRDAVRTAQPDLVLVSGDLTQRARPAQFRAAREFLRSLGAPFLATAGNHDVPLWNLFDRFLRPLARYRDHFAREVEPVHVDGEIAVVGISTARSLVVKTGRINARQITHIRARLDDLPDRSTKIVVTHHLLAERPGLEAGDRAGRADAALRAMAEARVDLLLAGHLHRAHVAALPVAPGPSAWGLVEVSAGTATSSRRRHEQNGFNLIVVDHPAIDVGRWLFDGQRYRAMGGAVRFRCDGRGWRRSPERRRTPPGASATASPAASRRRALRT